MCFPGHPLVDPGRPSGVTTDPFFKRDPVIEAQKYAPERMQQIAGSSNAAATLPMPSDLGRTSIGQAVDLGPASIPSTSDFVELPTLPSAPAPMSVASNTPQAGTFSPISEMVRQYSAPRPRIRNTSSANVVRG